MFPQESLNQIDGPVHPLNNQGLPTAPLHKRLHHLSDPTQPAMNTGILCCGMHGYRSTTRSITKKHPQQKSTGALDQQPPLDRRRNGLPVDRFLFPEKDSLAERLDFAEEMTAKS
jgi:hypothetical protein